jgi:tetratricopeptide (TPR) repeat protein
MEPTKTITPAFRPLFYNPGQLDPAQIESLFIARQELFQNLLADVLAERNNAAPQHHMIIGQRGMGKTTLLHRLAVELNKEPNSERFIPLTFPEEQHVLVERLSDFWLNALDALATALEQRKLADIAQKLDTIIGQLPTQHNDESELANACRREFLNQCQALQLRPVLLLDNFPLLLRKLDAHQWDLRSILQASGAPIFVAAGLALPESLGDYDSAFFDMFKARILYNLTLEECREIYHTMAKREGRENVISMISKNQGRLKTLHILTGGNPRTVGLLYELFARGLETNAWEDLRSLLDTMTPIYQSRLEQLSDKGQQIFAALALSWEPVLQQVIESQTQLPQGTLSSTLLRLEEAGVVEKVDIFGQKKIGWQVAERFFNIWFLMRFASRRTQGSIAALASFLELFYSPDELHGIARSLSGQDMDGERAHYSLAVSRAMGSNPLSRELCTHAQLQILQLKEQLGENLKNVLEVDLPNEVVDFFEFRDKILPSLVPPDAHVTPKEFARQLVSCVFGLGHRFGFTRSKRLKLDQLEPLMEIFKMLHNRAVRMSDESAVNEVEQRLYRGLLTDPNNAQQWSDAVESTTNYQTASLLGRLIPNHMVVETESAFRKAVTLNEKFSDGWNNLAMFLFKRVKRYEEAEITFRKAIESDEKFAWPWQNLGNLLMERFGRIEEAEVAYKKAIELDENYAFPWDSLGDLYSKHFNRYEDAEVAYRKSISLDKKYARPWIGLGNLLKDKLNRYEEAEAAYRRSIELDKDSVYSWNNLGQLLARNLNRYEEAEMAYRKAIELDDTYVRAFKDLGDLLKDKFGRYEEAEAFYRKAVELDEENAPWNTLGNLYADYLHKPAEAEVCYRKSLELDPEEECSKQNLIFLLRDQLNRPEEAEALLKEILPDKSGFQEVLSLHHATFALLKENFGESKDHLKTALEKLAGKFNPNSVDDWYRTAAVWLDSGNGKTWLDVWEDTGAARLFMPFFEAVKAHHLGDIRFLNNIPKEVQPTAREIFQEIAHRRRVNEPSTSKPKAKRRRSK